MNRHARQGGCCVKLVLSLRIHPFASVRCLSRFEQQSGQTAVPGRVDSGWQRAGPNAFAFVRPSPAACPAHHMYHSSGLSVSSELLDQQGPGPRISQMKGASWCCLSVCVCACYTCFCFFFIFLLPRTAAERLMPRTATQQRRVVLRAPPQDA